MVQSTFAMDHSNWYDTVRYYLYTSPTDTLQSTTTQVPILLISFNPLLPQYQSYWYDSTLLPQNYSYLYATVHFCPSTIGKSQSTTAPAPVLLIPYSPLMPQYKSYWYDTVHFCPSTSPTYSFLICHSPLLAKNQSYSYRTVHYCLNTSLIDTTQYTISSTRSTYTLQYSTTPVPVPMIRRCSLLIPCSPSLPQYQSYWYYCPLLPQYQSYWYPIIHCCPSTSPIDTTQSTTAPVWAMLLPTVNYCPNTSLTGMT